MTSPYRVLQVAHKLITPETFCRWQDDDPDNFGTARTDQGRKTAPRNATATHFTLLGAIARSVCDLTDGDYLSGHGWDVYCAAIKLIQPASMNDMEFMIYCDELGYKGCSELLEKHI